MRSKLIILSPCPKGNVLSPEYDPRQYVYHIILQHHHHVFARAEVPLIEHNIVSVDCSVFLCQYNCFRHDLFPCTLARSPDPSLWHLMHLVIHNEIVFDLLSFLELRVLPFAYKYGSLSLHSAHFCTLTSPPLNLCLLHNHRNRSSELAVALQSFSFRSRLF